MNITDLFSDSHKFGVSYGHSKDVRSRFFPVACRDISFVRVEKRIFRVPKLFTSFDSFHKFLNFAGGKQISDKKSFVPVVNTLIFLPNDNKSVSFERFLHFICGHWPQSVFAGQIAEGII
jgi:hypothetical protein